MTAFSLKKFPNVQILYHRYELTEVRKHSGDTRMSFRSDNSKRSKRRRKTSDTLKCLRRLKPSEEEDEPSRISLCTACTTDRWYGKAGLTTLIMAMGSWLVYHQPGPQVCRGLRGL